MKRLRILAALMVPLLVGLYLWTRPAEGQQADGRASWIWFDEGDPATDAPKGTVYFRKVFTINRPIQQPVDEGTLDITADNEFKVWVNGALVGGGKDWKNVQAFDVKKHLVDGKNVIAVEAINEAKGSAGLLVRLGYVPNGMAKLAVFTDATWKASKTAAEGWQKVDFDEKGWSAVKVLGPYGMKPWGTLTWQGGGNDDRFTVPAGFRVEKAVVAPANDKTFSLVNMCFDDKGRLLLSREGGAILVCEEPDAKGVYQKVRPYCTQVKNCQGMTWAKGCLLLVGDGPLGTGLYRCRDTGKKDAIDEVKLLHKFHGGMGEHGPHAIIHGPDDWLYLVVGNHAWMRLGDPLSSAFGLAPSLAKNSPLTRWPNGSMGPDQGKPKTTEDVLLPRLNDGRGHAANILAPGGTIWRLDHDGEDISHVVGGFRNHYDAAFSPDGELFTFDSDMEWDEALPWYRHVRVCHCPPGADFVWRTGAANTPDYYIDSLPPIAETGRGSPVGVEFYDHHVYPAKYRGSFFMADWAIGVIFAVHLEKNGASYKTKVEKFCQGAPMNVTDLAVGPDGAIYFTMGGRGSQGGVYRIVYEGKNEGPDFAKLDVKDKILLAPQPQSAWSRAQVALIQSLGKDGVGGLSMITHALEVAMNEKAAPKLRVAALKFLMREPRENVPNPLLAAASWCFESKDPELRATAVLAKSIAVHGKGDFMPKGNLEAILEGGFTDKDALVRRRTCEASIRAGYEPPIAKLWPLLGDKDRFVRHAARLVLERIDAKKWADRVWKEGNETIALNGIIALCHTNQANPYASAIFGRLHELQSLKDAKDAKKDRDPQEILDWLRTLQMAMIHCEARSVWFGDIAKQCDKMFPQKDWRINRELAILLVAMQNEGFLKAPIQTRMLKAIAASKDDRQQQIHYAYCMRLLKTGWTMETTEALTKWYDGTSGWKGGHSFVPFLENIYGDSTAAFSLDAKKAILANAPKNPMSALQLVKRLGVDRSAELFASLRATEQELATAKSSPLIDDLKVAVEEAIARVLMLAPTQQSLPAIVKALGSKNQVMRFDALSALRKATDIKPKPDDGGLFSTAVAAVPTFASDKDKWEAIQLLRQWTGRGFGATKADQWSKEHQQWALWFNQSFPKEKPLPTSIALPTGESKHKFAEVMAHLDKNTGDAVKGRAVFEKTNCFKCHKYGKDGEGVGPDLTTVAKRFKRADILDALLHPSKVISDQYRSMKITTKSGQELVGLVAVQGTTLTVLLSDASKVTLQMDQVDAQVASFISVMPERLLDPLTLPEIADLFAFMESVPK